MSVSVDHFYSVRSCCVGYVKVSVFCGYGVSNSSLYDIIVSVKLVMKAVVQIFLFHRKILKPSSMPRGMRLKSAIHVLMAAPSSNSVLY